MERKYKLKHKNNGLYLSTFEYKPYRVTRIGIYEPNTYYGAPVPRWTKEGKLFNIKQMNTIIQNDVTYKLSISENTKLESFDYKKVTNNIKLETLKNSISQKEVVKKLKNGSN
jgi:hypothetical protein